MVRRTLVRLDYDALGRAGKGTVREFLGKATGLSRAQVTRLIGQYRATGRVEDCRAANSGRSFKRVYTAADIRLLAEADEIGGQLCGPAACEVLRREYEVFGDARFERLSRLSPSHLYNLRRSKTYRARRTTVDHRRPTTVRIGERRRPEPAGKPGYVRVDTVHQGDRNGVKGVYDINLCSPPRSATPRARCADATGTRTWRRPTTSSSRCRTPSASSGRRDLRRPRRGRLRDVRPRGEPPREPRPGRAVPHHRPSRCHGRVSGPMPCGKRTPGATAPGPLPSPGGRDRRSRDLGPRKRERERPAARPVRLRRPPIPNQQGNLAKARRRRQRPQLPRCS